MNLTEKQWGLIEGLVSNFESTGGAEFCFPRSASGDGLYYEGPASVAGVYEETDLRQLEREGLITLTLDPQSCLRGKLTQHGIAMVGRRLMQQLFQTLTVTIVPEELKPAGIQVVDFRDPGKVADELESNCRVGMEMDSTNLIIEHPDFPLKPYAREKIKEEITRLEKKFSAADPNNYGYLEYLQREALGPEGYRQRQEQQATQRRQDVLEYFCALFFVYVGAYLDLAFGFQELSMLLPSLYDELLKQTFMLKWPRQQANDSESERATFAAAAAEYVSKSVKSTAFATEFRELCHRLDYIVPDHFSILQLMQWLESNESPVGPVQTVENAIRASGPDSAAAEQALLATGRGGVGVSTENFSQWANFLTSSHPNLLPGSAAASALLSGMRRERDSSTQKSEPVAVQRSAPVVKLAGTRGPKRDYGTAILVAEIVGRIASDSPWRSKLDEICCELDDKSIPRPKTWKKRGHRDWSDCLVSERRLVVKAIEHHLKLARPQGKIFS